MSNIKKLTAPTKAFVIVPNRAVQGVELSLEATGVLCYLLSLPKDWVVTQKNVGSVWGVGREKCMRIFKELSEAGYVKPVKKRKPTGAFLGTYWKVSYKPEFKVDKD